MKVYGRSGKASRVSINGKLQSSPVEDNDNIEFSSDDENKSTSRQSSDTLQTTLDTIHRNGPSSDQGKHIIEQEHGLEFKEGKRKSEAVAVGKSDAFAFLEIESKGSLKRRKTNYRRSKREENYQESGTSSPAMEDGINGIYENINDVNEYINSLNDDGSLVEKFVKEHLMVFDTNAKENQALSDKSVPGATSKKSYGRLRTILINKNEDEDIEALSETELQNRAIATEEKKSTKNNDLTHFNELKNMGTSLKYRDDLDFLQRKEMGTIEYISALVNFCITLHTDEDFKKIVMELDIDTIRDWCFESYPEGLQSSTLEIIYLLQGYLITTLGVLGKEEETNNQQLQNLLNGLPKLKALPDLSILNKHKMLKLQLNDFIQFTDGTTGYDYSLRTMKKSER
ncbi:Rad61p NDAI_0A05940 [Naumovozyma dairenensis CBS 421]|uniref:Rad61 Wapl domain-containing protein n=1 Tax=Naumovozyma dairenensis (strain ATCC 10597 / BCRC 20456 / CBS 421 / NBRC 0211 / NRRL Y-12639) TaxID=1071378 RepID=G0W4L1_NAUDC|nr:hypothetical protein NDAI_0A05940 [Naumovozyma dairenensis CBS 421]CCD22749.1 hypothetical protein NDAI_0A05940 [Naumovozyma dairenensis CBS 421]